MMRAFILCLGLVQSASTTDKKEISIFDLIDQNKLHKTIHGVDNYMRENQDWAKQRLSNGNSPIHYAIDSENDEMILKLIEQKAGLNEKDDRGKTPLHGALCVANNMIALALTEAKAELGIQDNLGNIPLHDALIRIPKETKIADAFIEKNSPLNVKNRDGYAPLHLAVMRKNEPVLRALIDAKADLGIQDTFMKFTPLHHAATTDVSITKLLIISKAPMWKRDQYYRYALEYAVAKDIWPLIDIKDFFEPFFDFYLNEAKSDYRFDKIIEKQNWSEMERFVNFSKPSENIDANKTEEMVQK